MAASVLSRRATTSTALCADSQTSAISGANVTDVPSPIRKWIAWNCHKVTAKPASTKAVPMQAMLAAIAVTMPRRSVMRPTITAPRPKPNMVNG